MKNIILTIFWYIVTSASLINIYAFIDYLRMSSLSQAYAGSALLVYILIAIILVILGLIFGIYMYHTGAFYKAYISIGLVGLLLLVGSISFI
jgi:hypothetical protein